MAAILGDNGIVLRRRIRQGAGVRMGGGGGLLPFSDNFARADGAIGNGWTGATWTIASNAAVNTPALGAELFINGSMSADTDWTKGSNWTIAAGIATHAGGSAGNLTQAVAVIGSWYRIVWTLTRTAGTFTGNAGLVSNGGQVANGTYTDSNKATATTAGINANTAGAGSVDNLSLKQLTLSELFATQNFGQAKVNALVKLTIIANNPCGLVVNLDSIAIPANFVVAYHNGTNANLIKCVAGTYTGLISTPVTYSAGAAIEIRQPSVGTYQLWYGGLQVSTDQAIADAAILAAKNHGMFNTYELNGLDDFSISTG